jgi:kinesin family protein C1
MGKRKGTSILSFQPLNGISLRKTRTQQDLGSHPSADIRTRSQHSGSYMPKPSADGGGHGCSAHEVHRSTVSSSTPSQKDAANGQQSRTSSLVNAFAELSLTPKQRKTSGPKSSTKHHPSLSPVKEAKSPSKIPKFSCTPTIRHPQSSQALFSTPSLLKQRGSVTGLRTPTTSAARRGASKDDLPVFLTKEKLTALPAWDTKGRLEDMEQMYIQLRSQFASAADSKSTLEETLSLYKSQGTMIPYPMSTTDAY